MNLNVAVVTLWAEDVPKTARFYNEVLGITDHHLISERVVHFMVNGIYLTIMKGTPCKATNSIIPRFPLVAFSVENIEEAMKTLNAHKVDMPWGIEEGPAAKWIMFHDPAGNLIELVEFQ